MFSLKITRIKKKCFFQSFEGKLILFGKIIVPAQYPVKPRGKEPRTGRVGLHPLKDYAQCGHFQDLAQPTLLSHDIQIGRDYLFDLLDEHRLLIRKRKRKKVTTNSRHRYRKYPNLIRHLSITRPEQVWVSDMTYIQVQNKWSYLSLITDAYSRKIMGYCFREDMKAIGCLTALKMAIARRSYSGQALIHHSDRASQYACEDYIKLLDHNHIDISMTEKSDPYENALAERINGIIKDEFCLYQSKLNFELTYQHIIKSIDTYNGSRPHASCNYLTPNEAHLCQGELKKRWKKYSRPQWIQRPDKNPKYYE